MLTPPSLSQISLLWTSLIPSTSPQSLSLSQSHFSYSFFLPLNLSKEAIARLSLPFKFLPTWSLLMSSILYSGLWVQIWFYHPSLHFLLFGLQNLSLIFSFAGFCLVFDYLDFCCCWDFLFLYLIYFSVLYGWLNCSSSSINSPWGWTLCEPWSRCHHHGIMSYVAIIHTFNYGSYAHKLNTRRHCWLLDWQLPIIVVSLLVKHKQMYSVYQRNGETSKKYSTYQRNVLYQWTDP